MDAPIPKLTPREYAVLEGIARGQNNAEIAAKMGVSIETVKSHVRRILLKLNARDRTQALVIALAISLIKIPLNIDIAPPQDDLEGIRRRT